MTAESDLFDAIATNDCGRISTLLQGKPALAASRNSDGIAAPLYALYHGRRSLLELLLSAGQPLDIFEAAAIGRSTRVRELLAAIHPLLAHLLSMASPLCISPVSLEMMCRAPGCSSMRERILTPSP